MVRQPGTDSHPTILEHGHGKGHDCVGRISIIQVGGLAEYIHMSNTQQI